MQFEEDWRLARLKVLRNWNAFESVNYNKTNYFTQLQIFLDADYRHSINSAILKLQETGKLGELKQKWWKEEREGEPCPSVILSTNIIIVVYVSSVV